MLFRRSRTERVAIPRGRVTQDGSHFLRSEGIRGDILDESWNWRNSYLQMSLAALSNDGISGW